jgi:hypothetical protein
MTDIDGLEAAKSRLAALASFIGRATFSGEPFIVDEDVMADQRADIHTVLNSLRTSEAETAKALERAERAEGLLKWIGQLNVGSRCDASIEERENDLGLAINHIQALALENLSSSGKGG